jgi:hypothetical protein
MQFFINEKTVEAEFDLRTSLLDFLPDHHSSQQLFFCRKRLIDCLGMFLNRWKELYGKRLYLWIATGSCGRR